MTSLSREDRLLISEALDWVNWRGEGDPLLAAVEAIVQAAVTAALNDAADAIEAVVDDWPDHDVAACKSYICGDCAVTACADDIRAAIVRARI